MMLYTCTHLLHYYTTTTSWYYPILFCFLLLVKSKTRENKKKYKRISCPPKLSSIERTAMMSDEFVLRYKLLINYTLLV
jgi:hypothetical protein